MLREPSTLRRLIAGLAMAGLLAAAPLAGGSADDVELRESGSVEISQMQIAFIVSGSLGGGTLTYEGKTYDFTIGGLGVGGFGASSIEATGTVFNLDSVEDFAGAYGQARAGIALGYDSVGSLWLENPQGVYMKLDAKRAGVMLAVGADAVYIKFK